MLVVRAGAETTAQEQPAAQVGRDAEQAAQLRCRPPWGPLIPCPAASRELFYGSFLILLLGI
jgi:hypothetical protein